MVLGKALWECLYSYKVDRIEVSKVWAQGARLAPQYEYSTMAGTVANLQHEAPSSGFIQ